MSTRHWAIEANTFFQRSTVRQWILKNADLSLLQFFKLAQLPNGSLWALISSDGSRCIEDLEQEFDYQGQVVLIEDEWEDWCQAFDALCSEYLDAGAEECFPLGSDELTRQAGIKVFVEGAPEDKDFSYAVRHALEDSRLIPRVSIGYWHLSGNQAYYRGRVVSNVTDDQMSALKQLGYPISTFDPESNPDLKRGFSFIRGGMVTLLIGRDSRGWVTEEYPIATTDRTD